MKNVFEAVIRRGGYDLNQMLKRIDEYHIKGKLTDAEHDDLIAYARGDAAPAIDCAAEIQRLWAAVREMQKEIKALKNGAPESGEDKPEAEAVQVFVQPTGAHDAYYAGNVVRYDGKVYTCVAPAGVACVWSPDVMPDYWEEQ